MLQMKAMTDSDGFVLKPEGTELSLVLWKVCFPPRGGWLGSPHLQAVLYHREAEQFLLVLFF